MLGGRRMCLLSTISKLRSLLHELSHEPVRVLLARPGMGAKRTQQLISLREQCRKNKENNHVLCMSEVLTALPPSLLGKLAQDDRVPFLIKYAQLYQQCFHNDCKSPPSVILSLDLGIQNAACVLLDSDYTVLAWQRLTLGSSPYNPAQCFNIVMDSLKQFPPADLYVMEEQTHRNPSNRGFLNISVQLRTIEAMVYAVLKLTRSSPVHTLSPTRVSRYFETSRKTGTTTANKKKMSVKLAMAMIDVEKPLQTPLGHTLRVPTHLRKYFMEEKKQDDLSDCLLQATAVLDWSYTAYKLL